MRNKRAVLLAVAAMASVLLFTACALNFSGGGWILSVDGVNQATFSTNFKCTATADGGALCTAGKATGSYHDHGTTTFGTDAVAFKYDGVLIAGGPALGSNNCWSGIENYISQNAAFPGSGQVSVTACDNGKSGPSKGDTISVSVDSGPFAGYSDTGTIQGGNLKASN